jgi:DNA polymerase V
MLITQKQKNRTASLQEKQKSPSLKLEIYLPDHTTYYAIPMLEGKVAAGFPSSAENYIDKALDLNELIIKHPSATFFIRVKGDSMENAGIKTNDILIVDRAVPVTHNKIVIARISGELTVKRICMIQEKIFLMPDNEHYQPMEITGEMDFEVWGVVTYVIHQV